MNKEFFKNNFLSIMSSISILLVMFLLLFSRGGYYISENVIPLIVSFVSFILIFGYKYLIKKDKIEFNTVEMLMLLFVSLNIVINILNIYTSKEDVFFGITKYMMMYIMYFFVRNISENKKILNIFLNTILALVSIVAVLGLDQLSIKLFPEVLDITYTTELANRLSSIFQYANATAVFIAVGIFIARYYEYTFENVKIKTLYNLISYFLFFTLLMTQSRICIFLVIVLLIMSIFASKDKSYRNLKCITTFISIVYSLVFYCIIYNFIAMQAIYDVLIYTIISCIPLTIFSHSINKIYPYFIEEMKNTKGVLKVLFLILFIVFVLSLILYKFNMPVTIASDYEKEYIVKSDVIDFDCMLDNIDSKTGKIVLDILDENKKLMVRKEYKLDNKITDNIQLKDKSKYVNIKFSEVKDEIIISKITLNNKNKKIKNLIIPNDIADRVIDIFNESESISLRKEYAQDGFSIFLSSPIIGSGNGSFKNSYQSVQKTSYISSESHSFVMDLLSNYGVVGFVIFIAILLITIIKICKLYLVENEKESQYLVMILSSLIVLIAHSTFDLDFSFMIIFILFAVVLGLVDNDKVVKLDFSKYIVIVCILLVSITQLYTYSTYKVAMCIDENSIKDFKYFSESKNEIIKYETVTSLAKYNYQYKVNLADRYSAYIQIISNTLANGTVMEKNEAKKELVRVIPLIKENLINIINQNPYNKYALQKASSLYYKNFISFTKMLGTKPIEELQFCINTCNKIIDVGPINNTNYSFVYQTLEKMYDGLDEVKIEDLQEVVAEGKKILLKELSLLKDKINSNYNENNIELNQEMINIIKNIDSKI